ncbi:MAG: hypothetical protein HY863_11560 [Chloroflexi bacterium]|nr:hypothetical protein [Chloroflexota bacterium]
MSSDQEQIRELAKFYSDLVIRDLAPDEAGFSSAWVDGYLDSGVSLDQALNAEGSSEDFMGFGSVELATAIIAPVIVEAVKVFLPRLLEIAKAKKTKGNAHPLDGMQVELKKERDRILLLIKPGGKSKKATQEAIDKIYDSLIKVLKE